ncbi:hypothetical protein CRG98_035072 [Punica granatum]|uniref:Hexosyltransferase n=1 Tax=Punica granatum TaxID=22663 RepID=A0A2I0IKK5_PUNGR|nr:hypothetical protein CRG98_035072 [Punica granatum]
MATEITNAATVSKPNSAVTRPLKPLTRAYVTFLAGDGDYVKGVVGLMKGLRKVRSKYPLVVAVLPDVPKEHSKILADQGCIVREIEAVSLPEKYQNQFARAYYAINYSKIRIWGFVEYSKMIYLDGDVQVYDNIDDLFDLPDGHFYAVMDCLCYAYNQRCPDALQWPEAELGPPPAIYFNAGMFVLEPSLSTYRDLIRTLEITPPTPFAEQDFLNIYFRDTYHPIPPIYNLVIAMLWRHPEFVELERVKVVHYCYAGSKPWRYTGKEENMDRDDIKMLVKKWWNIYNDESLDYKNYVCSTGGGSYRACEPANLLTSPIRGWRPSLRNGPIGHLDPF